jgi:hypothetical protein
VLAGAGVTAGSAAVAGQHPVSLRLDYICSFPSASRPVPVRTLVTATFPATATAGRPIKPTGTSIAVTLPRAAVADLARLNAAAVQLTANLSTKVSEGTRRATATWRHLRSPATAISRRRPLTLTASGSAPSVTAAAAGEVTVTAAGLSLLIARAPNIGLANPPNGNSRLANPPNGNSRLAAPSSGNSRRARPSGVRFACVLHSGQDATLARIAVTRSAPSKTRGSGADNPAKCQPFPKHLRLNPRFPLPKPLPGSKAFRQPVKGCSYAAGYTNARKLKEAALVGPGLTNLHLGLVSYTKFTKAYNFLQQNVAAQLEYHGKPELPPARATLLGFGFVPVSATLQISETGSLNAAFISCTPNPGGKCPKVAVVRALFFGRVTLRIYDVDVNGVPLNVGPHCQTVSPFNLELVGLPPAYNPATLNGVLTGFVTIPKFKGCANGVENLDAVFDATVSGPGNFVKINQAPFCTPINKFGCPPVKPKPVH